jgi:uncharacterized Rmd1/YagE family protein
MNQEDLQKKYLETLKDYSNIDKRLALMEQQINIIKTNHLAHIEKAMESMNSKFNWAVGVVFVQLIGIISFLMFKM